MVYKRWYDNKTLLNFWYIDEGWTIEEMAKKARVTQETIRLLLLKYNIKERKQ